MPLENLISLLQMKCLNLQNCNCINLTSQASCGLKSPATLLFVHWLLHLRKNHSSALLELCEAKLPVTAGFYQEGPIIWKVFQWHNGISRHEYINIISQYLMEHSQLQGFSVKSWILVYNAISKQSQTEFISYLSSYSISSSSKSTGDWWIPFTEDQ